MTLNEIVLLTLIGSTFAVPWPVGDTPWADWLTMTRVSPRRHCDEPDPACRSEHDQ
jgi:hypothetical protein